jgi:hypothetical protein
MFFRERKHNEDNKATGLPREPVVFDRRDCPCPKTNCIKHGNCEACRKKCRRKGTDPYCMNTGNSCVD